MPKTLTQDLAARIVALEAQVKALSSTSRLQYSSIDDFAIPVVVDGETQTTIGRQSDGSAGVNVVKVKPPPQLTAAILTVGEQAGTCQVGWDGHTFDRRRMPLIHGHTEIWAAQVGEEWEPTVAPPEGARRVGTIRDRTGGEVTVSLPHAGTWAVWLRAMGADRQTAGPWSPVSTVVITPKVDEQRINERLDTAAQERQDYVDDFNDRTAAYDQAMADQADALAAADAWSATAMYRTDELAAEALEAKLTADSAAVDAQDAQSKYDQVSARQDASDAEIAAAKAEAAAAHAEAGDARDYAVSIGARLDGVNHAIRSTQPPTGVPEEGDGTFWRQYDSMAPDRQLIGWWEYRDGAWEKIELGLSVLPRVEMGQAIADDFRAQRLFAETGEVERLLVSGGDLIADPTFTDDQWWRGLENLPFGDSSVHGRIPRITQPDIDAAGGQISIFTPRFEALPGKTYNFALQANRQGANNGGDNDNYRVWVRRMTPTGGWHSSAFSIGDLNSGGWSTFDRTFTIPDDDQIGLWEVEWRIQELDGGSLWFAKPAMSSVDGRITVEGLLRATEGVIRRLFTDETISSVVKAEIVRTFLIEADEGLIGEVLLKNGAVTADKIAVTEELIFQIARGITIKAGSLASNDIESMRIVSSLIESTVYRAVNAAGDETVRLDGMDNYIAGRLHAGISEGTGIALDWGQKIRFAGLTDEGDPNPVRTITTPYINFHTDNVTYQVNQEPSIHLDRDSPAGTDGMMIINPGYPVDTQPFRGMLNVVGDMAVNRARARESFSTTDSYTLTNDDENLAGGLSMGSDDRTYLLGRHHIANHTRGQLSFWFSNQYSLAAGGRRRRAFTWGAPPPTGLRRPMLSVHLTQGASNRWAYVVANSSHISATGYNINEHNPSSEYADYYVQQLAVWE